MDIQPHPDSVGAMWAEFTGATGVDAELVDAFAFGDSPAMADELGGLVRNGPKRATAGLLASYEADGDPVPEVGDHAVVVDGRGQAVAVIREVQVDVKPLSEVDAAFAWDEGEGDRTLEWWLDAHRTFFRRECEQRGVQLTDDVLVVLERFEKVWPVDPPG